MNKETQQSLKQLEAGPLYIFLRDLHQSGERNIGSGKVEIYSDSDHADAWRDPAYLVVTEEKGGQRLFKNIMSDASTYGRITHGLIEQIMDAETGEIVNKNSYIAVDDFGENSFYLGGVQKSALLKAVEKPTDFLQTPQQSAA